MTSMHQRRRWLRLHALHVICLSCCVWSCHSSVSDNKLPDRPTADAGGATSHGVSGDGELTPDIPNYNGPSVRDGVSPNIYGGDLRKEPKVDPSRSSDADLRVMPDLIETPADSIHPNPPGK
jgi:hypothetical protein